MAVRCDKFNHNGGGCACPEPGATPSGAENTVVDLDLNTGPYGPVQIPGAGLDWHAMDADDRWPGLFTSYAVREDDLQLRITPGDSASYESDGFEWEVVPVSPSVDAPYQSGHADTLADAALEAERAREYVTSGQAAYDAIIADDYDIEDDFDPEVLAPVHTEIGQRLLARQAMVMAREGNPEARDVHVQALMLMSQPTENIDPWSDPSAQVTARNAFEFAADRFGDGGHLTSPAACDDYIDDLSFTPMDSERARRCSDVMSARAFEAASRMAASEPDDDEARRRLASEFDAACHWAVEFRGGLHARGSFFSPGDLGRTLQLEALRRVRGRTWTGGREHQTRDDLRDAVNSAWAVE